MRTHRRKHNARGIIAGVPYVLVGVIIITLGAFLGLHEDSQTEDTKVGGSCGIGAEVIEKEPEPVECKDDFVKQGTYSDPNNYVYPYSTMSSDWGTDLYESGFMYYQIPQEYIDEGGCFPEVVQAYLWCLCEEKEINYYVVVALIERESRYQWDASGDNGNSKGYMQIYEKWHRERMEQENVTDLYNPYGNIRVGLNFLQELTGGGVNADYHYVLMSYNMGESKAKQFYKNGVYSTDYSTGILQRAQEIQQELQE